MPDLLTLYSVTWLFIGICNSEDQVLHWRIDGQPAQPSWHISPWLAIPIIVRGIELTKISGGQTIWWMAGNNIVGDTMLFLGPGENHGRHMFPAGMGQPMPAKPYAKDLQYLDLHGACSRRLLSYYNTVSIFYTVYYTLK